MTRVKGAGRKRPDGARFRLREAPRIDGFMRTEAGPWFPGAAGSRKREVSAARAQSGQTQAGRIRGG